MDVISTRSQDAFRCARRSARPRPTCSEKAGLGLTGDSALMSALLAVVLVVQFRTTAYRAGVY